MCCGSLLNRWDIGEGVRFFWKTGTELTIVIYLQRSRWSRGIYVNYGLIPNTLMVKPYPPNCEYWGTTKRAESTQSPFRDEYLRLSMHGDDSTEPLNMVDAFSWLLSFLESEYGDEEAYRIRLLAKNGDVERIMPAWAKGVLKEPWEYHGNSKAGYYCKPD